MGTAALPTLCEVFYDRLLTDPIAPPSSHGSDDIIIAYRVPALRSPAEEAYTALPPNREISGIHPDTTTGQYRQQQNIRSSEATHPAECSVWGRKTPRMHLVSSVIGE